MRILLLLITVVLMSCGRSVKDTPPADLIPEDSMVKVLAEVQLLEAAISIRVPSNVHPVNLPGLPNAKDPSLSDVKQGPIDSLGYYNIFSTFRITKSRYDSSMRWYCTHPDQLNELYEKVVTELTTREMKEAK
ncbi:MAG TPA: DUF4296 domain-containing protein [Bacteroidia bacterium]|jgi:hypothetical protein|nr:DUF4296 domain-containing protein [Bacteroidia bacterium]